jgi:hypothetical protein
MLGPDLPPFAGGLLKTPHPTPKTDKGTVPLSPRMVAKDSQADSDLTATVSLSDLSSTFPLAPYI